jgi:lipopolysaccharide transport system permease protein
MSIPNTIPPGSVPNDQEVVIVDANHSAGWFDLREVWRYRDLIWIFADRDIKVRYRQTVVGIAWTVLQPLAQMVAFNGLLQMLKSEPGEGTVPRPVSIFCGLVLYQLFAGILAAATSCLVDNRQLVTKVYFPRIVLPLSACLRPLLDFGIGLCVLIMLMLWFRVVPGIGFLLAPGIVLLTVLTGLAIGLWLSALNAHYRDFGYVVPFMLQIGMLVSPVLFESNVVPQQWRWLYHLNPLAAWLDAFRWAMLGAAFPEWTSLSLSMLSLFLLLISGGWYFRRVERFLADNI